MTNLEFLQYLNLALKQSNLSASEQDQLWVQTKALLDERTLAEVQAALAEL